MADSIGGISVTIDAQDAQYRAAMMRAAREAQATARSIGRSMDGLASEVQGGMAASVAAIERLNLALASTAVQARTTGAAMSAGFGVGSGFAGIAMQMAGFAAIMGTVGAGIKALDTMGQFERDVAMLGAVSESSAAQIAPLREQAIELGASTSRSATDVAKLQVELGKLGWSLSRIKDSTGGILNLSIAGDMDAGESAKLVGSIIQQFKLGASESQRVADLLAQASIKSAADVRDFATSMDYAGGIAAQYGWTLEETLASLMKLSDAGFNPSMGATGLRSLIFDFTQPTMHAKAFFKTIQFEARDATGALKPMAQLIDEFDVALKKRGYSVQTMPYGIIDTNSSAALAAMMQQGSAANRQARAALDEHAGAADRLAKVYTEGLKGAIERVGGSWDSFAISLGDTGFLKAVTEQTNAFANAIGYLAQMLDQYNKQQGQAGFAANSDLGGLRRRNPKPFDPNAEINGTFAVDPGAALRDMPGAAAAVRAQMEALAPKRAPIPKAPAGPMFLTPAQQRQQQERRLKELEAAAYASDREYELTQRAHAVQDQYMGEGVRLSLEAAKARAAYTIAIERNTSEAFRARAAQRSMTQWASQVSEASAAAATAHDRQRESLERLTAAAKRGAAAYDLEVALQAVKAADPALNMPGKPAAQEAERRAKELVVVQEANDKATRGMESMKRAAQEAADAIAGGFERAILEGGKLRDVLAGIARDLLAIVVRKTITEPLGNAIAGIFKGKPKGEGSPPSSGQKGIGSFLASLFGGMFADGGDPPVGKWSIVGERGPEIIVPKVPSTVIPNHVARSMMGGAANGNSATVSINIDARGADAGAEARIRVIAEEVAARSQQATFKALAQAQRARTSF